MSRLSSLNHPSVGTSAALLGGEGRSASDSAQSEMTISQMSRLFGVSLRTLRFYENHNSAIQSWTCRQRTDGRRREPSTKSVRFPSGKSRSSLGRTVRRDRTHRFARHAFQPTAGCSARPTGSRQEAALGLCLRLPQSDRVRHSRRCARRPNARAATFWKSSAWRMALCPHHVGLGAPHGNRVARQKAKFALGHSNVEHFFVHAPLCHVAISPTM